MKINYSDENVSDNIESIFLAGPTPRDTETISWREEAIRILEHLNYEGLVYVPERKNDDHNFDYDNQVEWEREALYKAKTIDF